MGLPVCDAKFFDGLRQSADAYFAAHPNESAYTIGRTPRDETDEQIPNNFKDPDARRRACVIPRKTNFHILGADFFCDAKTTIDVVASARVTRQGNTARTLLDKAILYFSVRQKIWRGCGVDHVVGELYPNTRFTPITRTAATAWCRTTPRQIADRSAAPHCRDDAELTRQCAKAPETAYAQCAAEAPVSFLPLKAALARVRFTRISMMAIDDAMPKMDIRWIFDGRTPKDGYDSKGRFTFSKLGPPMLTAILGNPSTAAVYEQLSRGMSIATEITGFLRYVLALFVGQGGTASATVHRAP